ncbi:casein kinase substrate phospho protein PP28-domain-containing protein [Coniella lustricola]|uniref:Casein kinase substrate phospho protein PP28-domain-containing protein n=1 Tax=Coniella lustricola TaxID=2025994 RepID=A0A2T3AHI0_9PEZI|nr:casein kinase substrate phospho protein PP28-domain-containing protein [Coniella lustricola]
MAGGGRAVDRARAGKFNKAKRGGGKHFSRDLRPLDADGNEISMWSEDAKKNASDSGSESDDEEDSEESSEDEAGPSRGPVQEEMSREDRRKEKKARKEAAIAKAKAASIQVGDLPPSDSEEEDDDMPANPNHSKAARKQAIAPPKEEEEGDVEEATEAVSKMSVKQPQSRRERESAEAAAAKERYMKQHLAGKTDEAKADIARLQRIREERERARLQREVCLSCYRVP